MEGFQFFAAWAMSWICANPCASMKACHPEHREGAAVVFHVFSVKVFWPEMIRHLKTTSRTQP